MAVCYMGSESDQKVLTCNPPLCWHVINSTCQRWQGGMWKVWSGGGSNRVTCIVSQLTAPSSQLTGDRCWPGADWAMPCWCQRSPSANLGWVGKMNVLTVTESGKQQLLTNAEIVKLEVETIHSTQHGWGLLCLKPQLLPSFTIFMFDIYSFL